MSDEYRDLIASYESDEGYPAELWIAKFHALDRFAVNMLDAAEFLTRDIVPISATISCISVRVEDGKDELFTDEEIKRVEYHTGGWSGSEDLIDAMLKQFWIAHFHTRWERGGHFYFEVPLRALRRTAAQPELAQ